MCSADGATQFMMATAPQTGIVNYHQSVGSAFVQLLWKTQRRRQETCGKPNDQYTRSYTKRPRVRKKTNLQLHNSPHHSSQSHNCVTQYNRPSCPPTKWCEGEGVGCQLYLRIAGKQDARASCFVSTGQWTWMLMVARIAVPPTQYRRRPTNGTVRQSA